MADSFYNLTLSGPGFEGILNYVNNLYNSYFVILFLLFIFIITIYTLSKSEWKFINILSFSFFICFISAMIFKLFLTFSEAVIFVLIIGLVITISWGILTKNER